MNKKHVKVFLAAAALIILVTIVFAFTGCDSGPATSNIYITKENMPQVVFVQGENLDLSAGKLTVEGKNETVTVSLTSPEVTVTGYDKNTLGKQSLTITYGEQSTTLDVTVIRRMIFNGCELNYFVNDEFNKAKGNIKITRNDGTTFDVQMSDDKISLEGFDSSTAKTGLNVTVRYTGANNEIYTDTLPANIYDIGEIKFSAPNKMIYNSHDTEFDFAGGFFTVTAAGNSSLYKYVELNKDMIRGFDPSLATAENRTTPLKQIVKIVYAGKTEEFPISIKYSAVSIMYDAAEIIPEIDWAKEGEEFFTEEVGEIALDAVTAYLDLTIMDKKLVSTEATEKVARVAALHLFNKYLDAAETFSDAFTINASGYNIKATSYESMVEVCRKFDDEDDDLYTLGALLTEVIDEFSEVVYLEQEIENEFGKPETVKATISNTVFVIPSKDLALLHDLFEHMVTLYEYLDDITTWTNESLEEHSSGIIQAVRAITNESYSQYTNYYYICELVNGWRENGDYFDIIYSYYLTYRKDTMVEELWEKVPFPNKMQDLYAAVATAYNEAYSMEQSKPLWNDTTGFMYYYKEALKLSEEIKNGDNELYKELYEVFEFDLLIQDYNTRAVAGYINLSGPLLGDAEYVALLDKFLTLFEGYYNSTDEKYDVDANKAAIKDMFDSFVSLTPMKQQAFLGSLYYLYRTEEVRDSMLFDYPELQVKGMFMYFIAIYLETYMPDTHDITQDMLLAIEYYLNKNRYESALDNFFAKMEAIDTAYDGLSTENQDLFDEYLGDCYKKYLDIYNYEKNIASAELSPEYSAIFEDLSATIGDFYTIYSFLSDEANADVSSPVYILLFATYEKADKLRAQILSAEDKNVIMAFYSQKFVINDNITNNLDVAVSDMRMIYISVLVNATITFTDNGDGEDGATAGDGTTEGDGVTDSGEVTEDANNKVFFAWDLYYPSGIQAFLADAQYLMYMQFKKATNFDAEAVLEIMTAMRNLDAEKRDMFFVFDGDTLYYDGLKSFFEAVLADDVMAIGEKLIEVERAYHAYSMSNSDEDRAAFEAAIAAVNEALPSVTSTDNYNQYLKAMFDFYLGEFEKLPEIEATV
ncbi:MAG: bacterial Ig-like domain-containing protein [Clostridia bacterium]|nr:bacterial Ig-like domain-containing protein [Clostridia bacterium]